MNELFSRGTKNWDEDWLKLTQCSREDKCFYRQYILAILLFLKKGVALHLLLTTDIFLIY